jgi:pantothenate kinase
MRSGGEVALTELAARVVSAAQGSPDQRYLLGITGPPAAGKSTLATSLADAISAVAGVAAQIAPMDGFHLPTAVLRAAGALQRKGQPDTFDVDGFLARLAQLRDTPIGVPVSWPIYDRALHDPVPDALTFCDHTVAVVEGNYLLLDRPGWSDVRSRLDQVWYLDADDRVIEQRLTHRHLAGGKTPDQARTKIVDSDLPNARMIARTRAHADVVLREHDGLYLTQAIR